MAPLSALWERSDYKLVRLNSCSYNGEIVKLQSALNDDYNNFSGKTKQVPHFRAHNWKFFPNLVIVRSLWSSFIDHSAPQRNAATLRDVLAPFSVKWSRSILVPFISEFLSFFFLFLDFTAISNCAFNNKNKYSTRAFWISNNYNHFGATIISSAPSLYANLRVPTRVYDVQGGAIFSKNSTFVFFDGAACTPRLRSPSPVMAPV